jgi:hypothetical protein
VSALHELREQLREAAHREVAARRVRRRRRGIAAALALALVGGGAAADATNVFESGPTAPDIRGSIPRYAPAPGERRQLIAAKVSVPGVPLPFGVAVYDTQEGQTCALAGVVNGSSIGALVGGTFRPYAADRAGTCNVPARRTIDTMQVAGKVVLYGLATPKTRTVVLPATGQEFRVGPDRAFLFVIPKREPMTVDMRE